jgi:hypothetical protein
MEISNETFDKYMNYTSRQDYLNRQTDLENAMKKENGEKTGSLVLQRYENRLRAQLETGYDPKEISKQD